MLAVHFNCNKQKISEISFIVIEKITSQGDAAHICIDETVRPRFQTFIVMNLSESSQLVTRDVEMTSSVVRNPLVRPIVFIQLQNGTNYNS